jgi:DTW domain-containing protein YfiP
MRVRAWLVAAVVVVTVAGCGDSAVDPKTWARNVCTALKPWSSTISELTTQTQQQMASVTTATQAKTSIVGLLDAEAKASESARKKVVKAGIPDVSNGKNIAGQFVAALASAQDAYATARDSISDLSTTNATSFYDGVSTAIDTMNKQYDAGKLDTSKVKSEDLQHAFDEVPQCQ